MTEQTKGQYEAVFRLFQQYISDAPLTSVARVTATDFLNTISKLHPHWGRAPKTKELSLNELLEQFGGAEERLCAPRFVQCEGVFRATRKHLRL
jgi:hypothetical protein